MTHHRFKGERTLMRIFIGESDKFHGKPLFQALLERLREKGFAGATVLRGVAGFGASSTVHTDKVLRLSLDLPIIIEVVETEEAFAEREGKVFHHRRVAQVSERRTR